MNITKLSEFARSCREFWFVLRTDQEARGQMRILVLGFATSLVLYYAATTVLLAPLQKKLKAARAQKQELASQQDLSQLAVIGPKIAQLRTQKSAIQKEIAILEMRERLQREHWRAMGEPNRFNLVIFTMNQTAPINIDNQLTKMSLGESRNLEMFSEQPVRLAGRGEYRDVMTYLRYLEKSPEIGALDDLELKSSREAGEDESELISFSLQVSRIELKESP
jgi:Tfp pilus assembly protein PilO